MTSAGAVDGFRDCEAIGVVGYPDFAFQLAAQVGFNWSSIEPGGARTFG